MEQKDIKDLQNEINHIFKSGVNQVRAFEVVKEFINSRYCKKTDDKSAVKIQALKLHIEQLEKTIGLLEFMIDNGLGEDDLKNDITLPQEI